MKKRLILIILFSIILISGISYSFFIYNTSQDESSIANSDCFKLTFEEQNDISLQSAIPIREEQAIDLVPYTFKVKNVCKQAASYTINIEEFNTTTINDNFVRYKLNEEESNILGNSSNNETIINDNVLKSKIIKTATIMHNEEVTYNLRLWIDENATIEAADKYFDSKVTIVSTLNRQPYKTILLDANGGTLDIEYISVIDNREIGQLPIPVKDDFIFEGWYTDPVGGELITNTSTFNIDTSIYAHWKSPLVNLVTYLRALPQDNTSVVQDDLSIDQNMRYVGANPNNYVLFNCEDDNNPTIDTCELWRIIGVFNSGSFSGYDGELAKIVRSESIGNFMVDSRQTSGNNYWKDSALDTNFKNNYPYTTNALAMSVTWKDGATAYADSDEKPMNLYTGERSNTKSKAYFYVTTYTGVVVLPYASDFHLATSGDGTLNSRNQCINEVPTVATLNEYWKNNLDESLRGICSNNSWLIRYSSDNNLKLWTVSAAQNNMNYMYYITPNADRGSINVLGSKEAFGILPSLYLKPNVICTNCYDDNAGSSANPLKLVLDNEQ